MTLEQMRQKREKLIMKRDKLNEQLKTLDKQIEEEEAAMIKNIMKEQNLSIEEVLQMLKAK